MVDTTVKIVKFGVHVGNEYDKFLYTYNMFRFIKQVSLFVITCYYDQIWHIK